MEFVLSSTLRAVAVLALLAAPPAAAQTLAPGGGYLNASKSEAIIGAPSRLAAILAQQSGVPVQQYRPQPAASGYVLTTYRSVAVDRSPVANDRPDVFGSVALPIGRTPLDHRWRKVQRTSASFAGASYATRLASLNEMQRIDAVNRFVNARVAFVDDIRQYRSADRWASAAETLSRGKGDCEDFAIAKLAMLRRAGFADRDLYLVILRDLTRQADHAVLAVRSGGRLWVLDNGTDRVVDSADVRDYRPIMSFSADKSWTHGYRRAAPPIVVATAPSTTSIAAASVTSALR